MDSFDVVVIGGGPGGYVAALRAAQLGMKVACIESRKTYGGTCLNVGCIPSKAMLDSSELYHQAHSKFAQHGIVATGVELDLQRLLERKDKVVKGLTDGIAYLLKKNKVAAIQGTAKLQDPHHVLVTSPSGETSTVKATNIILATGSEIAELPFMKFDHQYVVNSTDALSFSEVPKHLIVVGGGYIGLELGSVWARLGSNVTVLEYLPRILPLTDAEIGKMVKQSLEKQGLTFHLGTKVTGSEIVDNQAVISTVNGDGNERKFTGDKVLVAVGRRPNSVNLGLEAVGIQIDAKSGRVEIDDHYRTKVPHIYAIGDLVRGPMLAHKAQEEGVAVAELIAGKPAHVNLDTIPSVIYIWPEVASVGPTEEELKSRGTVYKVGKFPFSASGRARCMDESEGLVKVITDAATDRVLAVHIFGPRASDMIAEAVTIVEFKGSAEDIARITHAHPTLSESLAEAARMAYSGAPLHA
ncbi:MAG: dihydrolipoyl dehydrogenase [Zavarzinella sp.]